ncbi:MAG: ABC transporter substrate-binding protein [Planctomycetota bacterium]|jgi:ABC-type transport system substrate-binding protein
MKLCGVALALALLVGCGPAQSADGLKILRIPMDTDGPKSLDPVRGSTTYEARACSLIYETLFQYKYLVRPPTLEPCLLAKMPDISADGCTYSFELKQGVRFIDDPCFPQGRGREVVSKDAFYSLKRMADEDNHPKSWWLLEDTIVGFDEYREKQNQAETFDYDAPVEGMKVLDRHRFRIVLKQPVHRFNYVLEMFQTSVVPREAAERYGTRFGGHPVGTGPFLLERERDWVRGKSLTLHRNPMYREAYYPTEGEEGDEAAGLTQAAGERIPFLDRIDMTFFVNQQPKWLEFRVGNQDYVTVPAENFRDAFVKRTRRLRSSYRKKGIRGVSVPLLDFIFRGFNMEDPLVGGYTEKKRALRRAMHLAVDIHEFNDTFYNNICVVYDGPIPPDLDGHPPGHVLPHGNQGPDLDWARAELAKAGHPGGEGLPDIDYWVSQGGNSKEQSEMIQRQLARIGITLNVRLGDFSQLIEAVHNKKAQMFSFAWGSDYPDAENNLALFYGPNEAPGSNSFNYERKEFDDLYRRIRSMGPSPERTKIYEKMRDMLVEDVPYIGSLARTRYYLIHPWVKNCKPTETWWDWPKYLDVER